MQNEPNVLVILFSIILMIFGFIGLFKFIKKYFFKLLVYLNLKEKPKEFIIEDIQNLEKAYIDKKKIFDNLSSELNKIDGEVNLAEYGFYKPYFSFNSSEEYKNKIEEIREKQKQMIKNQEACTCSINWVVENSKQKGASMTKKYTQLMLRAFNGECDSSMTKVRWDNILTMEQRIEKSFEAINKLGEIHKATLNKKYYNLKIQELHLIFEHEEKKYAEKEEQKRIQEQIKEEEKAQKEIKEAIQKAEIEEMKYQKELDKAKTELEKTHGVKLDELNKHISILEKRILESNQNKQRAISRAELTKSGYVYIISNIGSFGKDVYKIGMTRRLEPLDRVRELSSASVPFSFDVHGLIYSDNAPELEKILHDTFDKNRLNLVNQRKEFFKIDFNNLENVIKEKNLKVDIIKEVEAKEFNETLSLKVKNQEKIYQPEVKVFPNFI